MVNLTYRGVKCSADEFSTHSGQTTPMVQYEDPSPNFARTGHLPAPQPVHRLTYGGVGSQPSAGVICEQYQTQYEPLQVMQPLPNSRLVEPSQKRSVLEYLQTRLKAAKTQGDCTLVNLLQQEIQLLF